MPRVEVYVDLGEFSDEEILQEVRERGLLSESDSGLDLNTVGVDADEMRLLLEQIWIRRRQSQDYQALLDQFIFMGLGKMT
jgi:hypothetical protein